MAAVRNVVLTGGDSQGATTFLRASASIITIQMRCLLSWRNA